MQRRSRNVLPPPPDDCTDNSTERPIIKSAPTNSVHTVRSLPPNGINGRHVPLPTSTSWGTQATSCQPPVGGLSHPFVLSKPNPDTVNNTYFVLVHGAYHGAWCWYFVAIMLKSISHNVTTVESAAFGINPIQVQQIRQISKYYKPLITFMESIPPNEA